MASTVPSAALARDFFGALYADADVRESRPITLWYGRGSRTTIAASVEAAADAVAAHAAERDVYFGVCLQDRAAWEAEWRRRVKESERDRKPLDYTRGFASTVAVVPGVWLDLDYGKEGHEQSSLPGTLDDVRWILGRMPVRPSITVATGGGLHCYWLFREPLVVASDAEREDARALVRAWNSAARAVAQDKGWHVDAVHDLARVLRPPGSLNHKHGACAVEAELCEARYDPSALVDAVTMMGFAPRADVAAQGNGSTLPAGVEGEIAEAMRADAEPPAAKLLALIGLHSKFKATYHRARSDLPSQSEYDMALAAMAAHAGWRPGEIVRLCVAHRRESGAPSKLDRLDYYEQLVARALDLAAGQRAETELKERARADRATRAAEEIQAERATEPLAAAVDRVREAASMLDPSREAAADAVAEALSHVRAALGANVRRVVKTPGDVDAYRIETPEGWAALGTPHQLLNPAHVRGVIASKLGVMIPRIKGAAWDRVALALMACAEVADNGRDGQGAERVVGWIACYLADHPPRAEGERDSAVAVRAPFWLPESLGGGVCLFSVEFRMWLAARLGERLNTRDMATSLREAGASPRTVGWTHRGRRTTAGVWHVPSALVDRAREAQDDL